MRPPTTPARTNDPEGMRRRLIDAAYRTFVTRGYNSTAVHALVREAGATGGAYSHHFPSKKALGIAVLEQRVSDAVDDAWIEPMRSSATVAEGVALAFAGIIAGLERQGSVFGCPLNNLALELAHQDTEIRKVIETLFLRWQDAIALRIRADQDLGLARHLDPEGAAIFIVAAYSGAMALAKARQSSTPLSVCAEHLACFLAEPTRAVSA